MKMFGMPLYPQEDACYASYITSVLRQLIPFLQPRHHPFQNTLSYPPFKDRSASISASFPGEEPGRHHLTAPSLTPPSAADDPPRHHTPRAPSNV